jgi:hypothetical protein
VYIRRSGMLKTFEQSAAMINEKKPLHTAGKGDLLRKLLRGSGQHLILSTAFSRTMRYKP